MKNIHEISMQARILAYEFSAKGLYDPKEIGERLRNNGLSDMADGFWVYNMTTNEEWYDHKFRENLGFENEKDFPNEVQSWRKQITEKGLDDALKALKHHLDTKGEHPYSIECTYNKKHGGTVDLICEGNVVCWEPEIIMYGVHILINS